MRSNRKCFSSVINNPGPGVIRNSCKSWCDVLLFCDFLANHSGVLIICTDWWAHADVTTIGGLNLRVMAG